MPVADRPPWLGHGGKAIYAVDVCPLGRRLATGGGDARTKIWDARPLFTPTGAWADAEAGGRAAPVEDASLFDGPTLLASLGDHYGPVNAVRFCPTNGKLLAAAGDDNNVVLYELQPGTGAREFGSKAAPNVENWRAATVCRGHVSNITDLAWNPDGKLFATCSLDNAVVIWTAKGKELERLEGHESYVKGVTWDPVGRYLATQGDDRRVIVWRTDSWEKAGEVTEPFAKSPPNRTHALRLAWSPCGRQISCTNAYDASVGAHTAPIVGRGNFNRAFDLVGHRAPVVAVRMNPRLRKGGASGPVCVVALGSQDRSLTVWNLSTARPSVHRGLFDAAVSDLAWDPSGRLLVACSTDGSVVTLQFFDEELGKRVSDAEHKEFLGKLYGASNGAAGGGALVESGRVAMGGGGGGGGGAVIRRPAAVPTPQVRRPGATDGRRRIVPTEATAGGASFAPSPGGRKRPAPTSGEGATERAPPALRAAPANTAVLALAMDGPPPSALQLELSDGNTLEFRNDASGCALACRSQEGNVVWADRLPAAVLRVAGGAWLAAGCADGTLHTLLPSGRRVLPPLVMGAAPAFLAGSSGRLLWCGADGGIAVFACEERRRELKASLAPVLNDAFLRGASVADVRLLGDGGPVCVLTDGRALAWSGSLETWLVVTSDDAARGAGAGLRAPGAGPSGELAALARAPGGAGSAALANFAAGGGEEDAAASAAAAGARHWEIRCAAARALGRRADAAASVPPLVRALVTAGDTWRLGTLVRALLPRSGEDVLGASPTPVDAQTHRAWLERDVLEPLRAPGAAPAVQRLFEELADELEAFV